MARTKTAVAPLNPIVTDADTPGLPAMLEAVDTFAVIEANYNQDRDVANQLLGEVNMASMISKFVTVTTLSKLQYIKENKLYKGLKGIKTLNGKEFLGTWAAYCDLLNMSVEKVDVDLVNLKVFGEEALDSMQRIGVGYRELRQYRQLPATQQEELIEAAKSGDKDTFLEVAEDLIVKHIKEKTDLKNQLNEAEQNYEAQGKVLSEKESKISQLSIQLNVNELRTKTESPDDIARDLRAECNLFAGQAEDAILKRLSPAFKALTEHSLDNGGTHQEIMLGFVSQIELALIKLREEFGLVKASPDSDLTPEWNRPEAQTAIDRYANYSGPKPESEETVN